MSPVHFVLLCGFWESKLVKWLISCYRGYSSNALQTLSQTFFSIYYLFLCLWLQGTNTAVTEKPSRLWWSYRFTLRNVFSLWKGETELGLLTAGNGLGGGLRAGNDGSCSFNEGSSPKKQNKKRGMTDTGLCEKPPASSTLVQIHGFSFGVGWGINVHQSVTKQMVMHMFLFSILPTIKPVTKI